MNLCPVLPEHPRIIYRVPGALTAALHGPEGLGVFILMKSTVSVIALPKLNLGLTSADR